MAEIDIKSNVTVNHEHHDRKAYDNREVKPGEVLVPLMAFDDRIKTMDVDPKNIRTWCTGGKKYKVIFYPVPEGCQKIAFQQFYSELNEFLGERRDARCLIPQEDGSLKICPKKSGNNRQACTDCPHNGEYQREDKNILSLNYLQDEFEYEPESNNVDLDIALLKMTYDDLMNYLESINPRYARIVSLGMNIGSDGINLGVGDKKELVASVIQDLGLKKSQAYQEINSTMEQVKKFLNK